MEAPSPVEAAGWEERVARRLRALLTPAPAADRLLTWGSYVRGDGGAVGEGQDGLDGRSYEELLAVVLPAGGDGIGEQEVVGGEEEGDGCAAEAVDGGERRDREESGGESDDGSVLSSEAGKPADGDAGGDVREGASGEVDEDADDDGDEPLRKRPRHGEGQDLGDALPGDGGAAAACAGGGSVSRAAPLDASIDDRCSASPAGATKFVKMPSG